MIPPPSRTHFDHSLQLRETENLTQLSNDPNFLDNSNRSGRKNKSSHVRNENWQREIQLLLQLDRFRSTRLYKRGWQRRKVSSQSHVSVETCLRECISHLILNPKVDNITATAVHHHVPCIYCQRFVFKCYRAEPNNDTALWCLLSWHVTRPFLVWLSIIETKRNNLCNIIFFEDFFKQEPKNT